MTLARLVVDHHFEHVRPVAVRAGGGEPCAIRDQRVGGALGAPELLAPRDVHCDDPAAVADIPGAPLRISNAAGEEHRLHA